MSQSETGDPRARYFDSIADRWDGWEDLDTLPARFAAGLEALGLGPDETVVDVGCGTGNLSAAILRALSSQGRVLGVDISAGMLEQARAKVSDPRVTWHHASVERLPFDDASVDRVICFSAWPHVVERAAAANELLRVLRPGGIAHVWHSASRQFINHIHAGVGGVIAEDVLPPAEETAALLSAAGLQVTEVVDAEDRYLVSASRPLTA